MEIRYYRDPESGFPHIYDHGVTEAEVERILAHPAEDEACADDSRQALGQTESGRYLRVVYFPDEEGDGYSLSRHIRLPATNSKRSGGENGDVEDEKTKVPERLGRTARAAALKELDARTDEEWVAADEAAAANGDDQAVITVPAALLPEIRRLLATHRTA